MSANACPRPIEEEEAVVGAGEEEGEEGGDHLEEEEEVGGGAEGAVEGDQDLFLLSILDLSIRGSVRRSCLRVLLERIIRLGTSL